jgi:hypothetical protein
LEPQVALFNDRRRPRSRYDFSFSYDAASSPKKDIQNIERTAANRDG